MKTDGILTKITDQVRSTVKTILCFSIFYSSIPILVLCYLFVTISRTIWLTILSMKYPNLEFVKSNNLRSLLDTPRNPGLIHVLLHIEGKNDIETVKEKLFKYVLDRKDKVGQLCFTKLKTSFITCWGFYAWTKNYSKFNINNHVILHPATYRGRPVNENNIQEYISTIVSKYIPLDIPQWQISIIPNGIPTDNNTPETYYILLRIHHLILSQEPELSLRDMLLLDTFTSHTVSYKKTSDDVIAEPMRNLIDMPIHIPKLYNSLMVSICNQWNEFIYQYDPAETDHEKKQIHPTSVTQLIALICISFVTVLLDFYKGFHATKNDLTIKIKFLTNLIKREIKKRDITFNCVYRAVCHSFGPSNLIKTFIKVSWNMGLFWIIKLPYGLFKETISLGDFCFGIGQTEKGYLVAYLPLFYNAIIELIAIVLIIIRAPRFIYEELIEQNRKHQHALQNVSLCGRKIVAWTEKININDVKNVSRKRQLSDTELYYSTTSAALNLFLNEFKYPVPKYLATCVQYIGKDYLVSSKNYTGKDVNGFLCVRLPMQIQSASQIKLMRQCFQTARKKQITLNLLYAGQRRYELLTKILPAVWIQILFNYLTKQNPIAIAQIQENSHSPIAFTQWGHKIIDAIHFMSTQSNIGASLTLQQFGEHIRLGIMVDSQISPLHSKITQSWTSYLNDIIKNT